MAANPGDESLVQCEDAAISMQCEPEGQIGQLTYGDGSVESQLAESQAEVARLWDHIAALKQELTEEIEGRQEDAAWVEQIENRMECLVEKNAELSQIILEYEESGGAPSFPLSPLPSINEDIDEIDSPTSRPAEERATDVLLREKLAFADAALCAAINVLTCEKVAMEINETQDRSKLEVINDKLDKLGFQQAKCKQIKDKFATADEALPMTIQDEAPISADESRSSLEELEAAKDILICVCECQREDLANVLQQLEKSIAEKARLYNLGDVPPETEPENGDESRSRSSTMQSMQSDTAVAE